MIAKRNIIPIFVPHMGCPNNCVFCNQHRITGNMTPPDEETVRESIINGLSKTPAGAQTQLAFYGGSFTAIPVYEQKKLLGAALPFLHFRQITSIRISTRPDAINEDTLQLLKEYGVKTIELGSQSMCEEVLRATRRGHTPEQTDAAARLIKDNGFELILQMMTGLPGDTKERSIETAKRIISLKPDGVRIYPTVIIENTELYDMWKAGVYREHTLEEAVDWCAEILPMFEEAKIPVIRLGLNPTEELSDGAAIAGAYHPALGELVASRIMLDRARKLLRETEHGNEVILGVNKSDVSIIIGQHRMNAETLKSEFGLKTLKVTAADIPRGQVVFL